MKVFNWVHNKLFHTRSDSSLICQDGRRLSKVEFEKNGLLDLESHGVINTWENGILAIGTLDIGPFACDDQMIKDHDEDDHDGGGGGDDHDALLSRHELEKEGVECKEIEEVVEEVKDCEVKAKRRVTLAELFSLDPSDEYIEKQLAEDDEFCVVQNTSRLKPKKINPPAAKIGLAKAKKFLKDDLSPLNMFNQLLKTMIKKKIHPDLGVKMEEEEIQMQTITAKDQVGPHESINFFASHSRFCGLSGKI